MDRNVILTKIWNASESGELITVCAWCERVRIEGEWVMPTRGALDTIDQRMTLSHSICPTCGESHGAAPGPVLGTRRAPSAAASRQDVPDHERDDDDRGRDGDDRDGGGSDDHRADDIRAFRPKR